MALTMTFSQALDWQRKMGYHSLNGQCYINQSGTKVNGPTLYKVSPFIRTCNITLEDPIHPADIDKIASRHHLNETLILKPKIKQSIYHAIYI